MILLSCGVKHSEQPSILETESKGEKDLEIHKEYILQMGNKVIKFAMMLNACTTNLDSVHVSLTSTFSQQESSGHLDIAIGCFQGLYTFRTLEPHGL